MIEVENLSKIYGVTPALQNISFQVEKGEILGFLGPNGAGKTTTMRILSGYLPASSGTAKVAGFEVHENSMEVRQRIGYLPENPPLYPEMTVEGFLYFVSRIKKVAAGEQTERVQLAMKRCGLLEKRRVLIRKLSKGFRQRVGIAQAIVHDPPVIILDEPTVGLDPQQIIEVRHLIKSLAGQHTIILSTHILPEVSMTCSRVAIINRGHVVATGTPEHLMLQLGTGIYYELEIEGDWHNLSVLRELPGVRSVEFINVNNLPENRQRLQVVCEPEKEVGGTIISTLVSQEVTVCEMRRNRGTLEDVFLQLISQDISNSSSIESAEASSNFSEVKSVETSPHVTDESAQIQGVNPVENSAIKSAEASSNFSEVRSIETSPHVTDESAQIQGINPVENPSILNDESDTLRATYGEEISADFRHETDRIGEIYPENQIDEVSPPESFSSSTEDTSSSSENFISSSAEDTSSSSSE